MSQNKSKSLGTFRNAKQQCLNREDLSKKGSIDEPIRPLVTLLNENSFYYTTSSCSGRISLLGKPKSNPSSKKGRRFLLNSHNRVDSDEFHDIIRSYKEQSLEELIDECLWLKYEPFILHVQCYDLERARGLLNSALSSGCRNSGITLGKDDKFLVAVRSTSSMEVPIHSETDFELGNEYVMFLQAECNRRLEENFQRLDNFQKAVAALLATIDITNSPETVT